MDRTKHPVYAPVESSSRDDNMTSGSMKGMSVKPGDEQRVDIEDQEDVDENKPIVKFVQEKFKKRTCKIFFPKTSGSPVCRCGYAEANHSSRAEDPSRQQWHTEESPTDAFGDVEFVISGQKVCKYIRVDYKTEVKDLMTLMLDYWQMETPNLLISVTGGAQNFTMKPRLKEVFRQGLVKAAQSTHAWIITGGTNTGVMKHVGEALRDYAIKYGNKKQLVALGIATWGCIENRDGLIPVQADGDKKSYGCWPSYYKITESPEKKKESPLDPNHTHFILVDNGTRQQFGVEIDLRAKLESEISKRKTTEESVSIPVVCIVLEGGPNTLETVKKAIDAGTPAIIVEGSGRAADVLAHAFKQCIKNEADSEKEPSQKEAKEKNLWAEVAHKIEETFNKHNKDDIENYVESVKACVEKRDYLTVFSLDDGSSAKDIDITILEALLKINRGNALNQLKLALAWDRVDVAREKIFTDGVNFKETDLNELMYSAILNDRVEFVKLFLDKGLSLKDFLTVDRLLKLYNEPLTTDRCRQLQRKTKKQPITMKDIGSLIKELNGELFEPIYNSGNENRNSKLFFRAMELTTPFAKGSLCPSDEPSRDLFLWSVLIQRREMAMVFWYEGKEDLALAVVAHLLLRTLLEKEPDPDLNQDLLEQINFYEDLAVGLLTECHSSDQRKSTQLLVREIPAFGKTTVLKMAVQADNKNFVAHPACQNLLTEVWTGKLSDDNHYIKLLLATFCFFLAPFLLKFREKERRQTDRKNVPGSMRKKDSQANLMKGHVTSRTTGNDDDSGSSQNGFRNYFEKLSFFFQAPVIKFCYNCMTYFAFLLLFGIILLTDFYPTIGIKEEILIAWVVTLLFEEIRQMAMDDAGEIRRKFYNYITDIWNVIDVVTIVTFLAGMILRFIPVSSCDQCFYAARIILALNFMTFFFRVLHMFSIHRELGPKLVMIGKMMIDLFYFMIILLVFIAAYGIASHVILYPNQPLNIALARDVLSRSWWNIFGELGIDEVSGDGCKNDTALINAEQCASLDSDEFSAFDCGEYKAEQCPSIGWLVPIVLAIYVLITNVLMLNLLIAMFSNTFANIQGQTNVVWKMQRYHLVREYESRPMLPPPLIVVAHVYLLIRYCIRHFCCPYGNRCPKDASKFRLSFKPQSTEEKELLYWENVNAEEFLRKRESDEAESADKRATDAKETLEAILHKVEEIVEKIPMFELLEKRLEIIEKQLNGR